MLVQNLLNEVGHWIFISPIISKIKIHNPPSSKSVATTNSFMAVSHSNPLTLKISDVKNAYF